jgi:hypothetical protein
MQLTEALQAVQRTVKAANQVWKQSPRTTQSLQQDLRVCAPMVELPSSATHTLALCTVQDSEILQKFPVFGSYSRGDFTSSVSFKHAAQLSEEQSATIWKIFEANMKDIYTKDSQKWNPKEKRRELFNVSTRPCCCARHLHPPACLQQAASVESMADALSHTPADGVGGVAAG